MDWIFKVEELQKFDDAKLSVERDHAERAIEDRGGCTVIWPSLSKPFL